MAGTSSKTFPLASDAAAAAAARPMMPNFAESADWCVPQTASSRKYQSGRKLPRHHNVAIVIVVLVIVVITVRIVTKAIAKVVSVVAVIIIFTVTVTGLSLLSWSSDARSSLLVAISGYWWLLVAIRGY